jgi:hypothetical protein
MTTKLTKAIIADAPLRSKEYFLWDMEVRNFGVRVWPSGRKMFVYQYRFNQRSRRLTIGPADVVPLPLARELALEAAVNVNRGVDPIEERDAKRNAITVNELATRFDDVHIFFHVKESTAREYRYSIKKYILPAFGAKKVADVERAIIYLRKQWPSPISQSDRPAL